MNGILGESSWIDSMTELIYSCYRALGSVRAKLAFPDVDENNLGASNENDRFQRMHALYTMIAQMKGS